ncbi:MAG: hypothetical protein JXR94_09135 [Candidatus Hydrogenedentes bacterium]|nr:hypothetical protein [Candidatus Hydrogenedentota bacterium]
MSTPPKPAGPPIVPPRAEGTAQAVTRCRACWRSIGPDDAYCPHCGVRQARGTPWYYEPVWILVLALAVIGPFALILVWRTPKMTRPAKIGVTVIVVACTGATVYLTWKLLALLIGHYTEFSRQLDTLNL